MPSRSSDGEELWRSDGTAAGTQMMRDLQPAGAGRPWPYGVVGRVVFTADDGTGLALWASDGTAAGRLSAPTLGAQYRITLDLAWVNAGAAVGLGASNTLWGNVPLPAAIPGTSCFVNVALDVLLPVQTNARGQAMVAISIPATPNLLGQTFYAQWLIADPFPATGIVTTRGGAA